MDVSEVARLSPAAQKQILAKMGKQAKENKLHNVPTSRCLQGGKPIRFPSRKEARRKMRCREKSGYGLAHENVPPAERDDTCQEGVNDAP